MDFILIFLIILKKKKLKLYLAYIFFSNIYYVIIRENVYVWIYDV